MGDRPRAQSAVEQPIRFGEAPLRDRSAGADFIRSGKIGRGEFRSQAVGGVCWRARRTALLDAITHADMAWRGRDASTVSEQTVDADYE